MEDGFTKVVKRMAKDPTDRLQDYMKKRGFKDGFTYDQLMEVIRERGEPLAQDVYKMYINKFMFTGGEMVKKEDFMTGYENFKESSQDQPQITDNSESEEKKEKDPDYWRQFQEYVEDLEVKQKTLNVLILILLVFVLIKVTV